MCKDPIGSGRVDIGIGGFYARLIRDEMLGMPD